MSAKALLSASVSAAPVYVEDVFSTYLYTGNSSTQTITNGIDLAGEGGLVWTKMRINGAFGNTAHCLFDTARGVEKQLSTNITGGQASTSGALEQFNPDGYQLGSTYDLNYTGTTYASWTFRKAEKFFDVVTWTGDGTSGRAIPHNLGSAPGFIAVKITSSADNWECYHRGVTFNSGNVLWLNSTNALTTGASRFTSAPDATNFYVGSDSGVNGSGQTYVAYLFAHDAGGFGTAGTDSVVSCGSFTTDGSGKQTVDLGWEPQWILVKSSNDTGDWQIIDNMRGWPMFPEDTTVLRANLSSAEITSTVGNPTATGFIFYGPLNNAPYIYIAIRRGPMNTPTDATEVFEPVSATLSSGSPTISTASVVVNDALFTADRNMAGAYRTWQTRLTGGNWLNSASTGVETSSTYTVWDLMSRTKPYNYNDGTQITYNFRRAPGFFDVVAYTGNGSTQTIAHNLGVVPELIIAKNRTVAGNNWPVLFNFASTTMNYGFLNLTDSGPNDTYANVGVFSAAPTATSMFLVNSGSMNASGSGIIAYLFATAPGVSKVGSYTGTGTTLSIDCGFTAGARFVMITRTDSTGDWYVWDTARGIISGDDPYLLLNSTAAEVTNTDYIDPLSSGFQISSTAPAAINASGGSFIFLAIA